MAYERIDHTQLKTWSLSERKHRLDIQKLAIDPAATPPEAGQMQAQLENLRDRFVAARKAGASRMLAYGAHLIKNGGATLVNWLVENGWVTHIATQGAGIIHDWEFAYAGVSGEWVHENAPRGTFGAWSETGRAINLAVAAGAAEGLGFGEAMGKFIADDGLELPSTETLREQIADKPDDDLTAARADLLWLMVQFNIPAGVWRLEHPFKTYSVPACCYRNHVAITVHPGIGYDIFTNHPMYTAAAIGRAAGTDFDVFTKSVRNLDGGVYMSVGSAIMSPQVFEKAFSSANNLRSQDGESLLSGHFIGIVDIQDDGGWDWSTGEPPEHHPAYYLRFCKSFYRMGGTVDYLCGDNRMVLANLVAMLRAVNV